MTVASCVGTGGEGGGARAGARGGGAGEGDVKCHQICLISFENQLPKKQRQICKKKGYTKVSVDYITQNIKYLTYSV